MGRCIVPIHGSGQTQDADEDIIRQGQQRPERSVFGAEQILQGPGQGWHLTISEQGGRTLNSLATQKFKPVALPTANSDPLSTQQDLTNRAIAMHLLREGQFGVASTFIAEASTKPTRQDTPSAVASPWSPDSFMNGDVEMEDASEQADVPWTNDFAPVASDPDNMQDGHMTEQDTRGGELQKKFTEMYNILHALRNNHDLEPAITWARQHSETLELRGSNLEFELCRLRFVELYNMPDGGTADPDAMTTSTSSMGGPLRALEYARSTFSRFSSRYFRETASLVGSLAFSPDLVSSPYKNVFYDSDAWNHVAQNFVREFCGMLGLSEQSPLYTAVTAGGIALPVLEKLEKVMDKVGGQWTSVNELPVRYPHSLVSPHRS